MISRHCVALHFFDLASFPAPSYYQRKQISHNFEDLNFVLGIASATEERPIADMSDEDKELLARIGQLAGKNSLASRDDFIALTIIGQINRHKSHQATYRSVPPTHHPVRHRGLSPE